MPVRQRPRRVLCATLTADGKLDPHTPAVPPVLHRVGGDSTRHPWAALYDEGAAVLISSELREQMPVPSDPSREVAPIPEFALSPEGIEAYIRRLTRISTAGIWRCFGGAELFRALLEASLVDELRLIVRPQINGRRGSAALSGAGGEFFPASVACRLVRMEVSGDECLLHYRVRRHRRTAAPAP